MYKIYFYEDDMIVSESEFESEEEAEEWAKENDIEVLEIVEY